MVGVSHGLVLVTGATGSGKSTTLAALLEWLNGARACHIVTLEDPIEYVFRPRRAIIHQREIGTHVDSFASGLRAALRGSPDVILVGEMRDRETIRLALTAAETGHLVFSTLHTTGAARTVDRITDVFPHEQQEQIRTQLSGNLVAVISQLLLPVPSGHGRVAAFEIMIATPAIGHLIRERKTHSIFSAIQTGHQLGMVTLDASLVDLYSRHMVTREEALRVAEHQDEVIEKMREVDAAAAAHAAGPRAPANYVPATAQALPSQNHQSGGQPPRPGQPQQPGNQQPRPGTPPPPGTPRR
jgi:twitching motility protein PilT